MSNKLRVCCTCLVFALLGSLAVFGMTAGLAAATPQGWAAWRVGTIFGIIAGLIGIVVTIAATVEAN